VFEDYARSGAFNHIRFSLPLGATGGPVLFYDRAALEAMARTMWADQSNDQAG